MAEVIGPCATLPGAQHSAPNGVMCDEHEDLLATNRVQGETDSFGAELHDLCAECHEKHRKSMVAYREEIANGCCDWCGNEANDLRHRRDFEEGMGGRLYLVCGACVRRENDALAEEAEASRGGFLDYHDYDPVETGEDDWDDEYSFQESTVEGPELPAEVLPPQGYPRAYVDGQFFY